MTQPKKWPRHFRSSKVTSYEFTATSGELFSDCVRAVANHYEFQPSVTPPFRPTKHVWRWGSDGMNLVFGLEVSRGHKLLHRTFHGVVVPTVRECNASPGELSDLETEQDASTTAGRGRAIESRSAGVPLQGANESHGGAARRGSWEGDGRGATGEAFCERHASCCSVVVVGGWWR